jgi:hypothetical protein
MIRRDPRSREDYTEIVNGRDHWNRRHKETPWTKRKTRSGKKGTLQWTNSRLTELRAASHYMNNLEQAQLRRHMDEKTLTALSRSL